MNSIIKHPSAWIPITMSLTVLATMIIGITVFSAPHREIDEGVGAHLFQIWLALEVFMMGFFAVKWLPQAPKQTSFILALQIISVLMACYPVFYFKL